MSKLLELNILPFILFKQERGIEFHNKFDIDEETRFSSVFRGQVADDSAHDENEDISFNSRNLETFGGSPGSDIRFADTFSGKCSDVASVSSSSSLVYIQLAFIIISLCFLILIFGQIVVAVLIC